jgi:malate dehydrogenase (oxaloacetate-decarboxylating)(NADP+)
MKPTKDPVCSKRGVELLRDPYLNKGTAFTKDERAALGLQGLLPPHVLTIEQQAGRYLTYLRHLPGPFEKFVSLMELHDRNKNLFYHVMLNNMPELTPIVYTPTVGKACVEFSHIFRRSRGLFVSLEDRGHVKEVLANWPEDDIRVIVVTDGERILGLGDLGANGMGIPIGKLVLYSACAGIHPRLTLPVTLDVGTNNENALGDPLYIGINRKRERGAAYDELIEEFVQAVFERYPKCILQFEDFGNTNAFRLLERYRHRVCCFNDDIQGTAGVTLAGLYSALQMLGKPLVEQKIMFLGAGEAGIGIADLIVNDMVVAGMKQSEARQRIALVDSKGLVCKSRKDLQEHKLHYAHDLEFVPDLASAVKSFRPNALIGVSGMPRTFTKDIVEEMARINERPIIFALSNPTANSECTAEEAYTWTQGRAIYASGSPFEAVRFQGKTFIPCQANNAYVFPGVGLGVMVSEAKHVTDEMFAVAAKTLSGMSCDTERAQGCLFPSLNEIRRVSLEIATAVAEKAYETGLARAPRPADLRAAVKAAMFQPGY